MRLIDADKPKNKAEDCLEITNAFLQPKIPDKRIYIEIARGTSKTIAFLDNVILDNMVKEGQITMEQAKCIMSIFEGENE